MNFQTNYEEYDNYSTQTHERTFFDGISCGFVVTEIRRLETAKRNKQELEKYEKERQMCIVLAKHGFKIEHLSEVYGIPSHDININGVPADLKRLSSCHNIERHAKQAIQKQGARLVIFQFEKEERRFYTNIADIQQRLKIMVISFLPKRKPYYIPFKMGQPHEK